MAVSMDQRAAQERALAVNTSDWRRFDPNAPRDRRRLLHRAMPGLYRDELRRLSDHVSRHVAAPGDVICSEGECVDTYFVVLRGTLRVEHKGSDDVKKLGPGDHFGELGVLYGVSGTATVVAETAVELLVLGRQGFHDLLSSPTAPCRVGLGTVAAIWSVHDLEVDDVIDGDANR
jgi:CRP-like cAMP-binding protein